MQFKVLHCWEPHSNSKEGDLHMHQREYLDNPWREQELRQRSPHLETAIHKRHVISLTERHFILGLLESVNTLTRQLK